jgi:hypothetical protein
VDTETVAPDISTSQPIANTVAPQQEQAQSETRNLSGDDGPGVPTGVVAGVAAAAAVILAGIAYRIARGRPRTE